MSKLTEVAALSEQFAWEDFLRSLSAHLKKAYEPLIAPYMRRHALTAPPPTSRASANGESDEAGQSTHNNDAAEMDLIERATMAATQAALQSVGYGSYTGQQLNGSTRANGVPSSP